MSVTRKRERLTLTQTFGLRPPRLRMSQAMLALRGQDDIPASRWGLSSVKILKPWISLPTWLGRRRRDRRVPIYNFFNRSQTDPAEGWSVRVTQTRDFRGGSLTYDSHNGTDFVVPTGTTVCAPADGRVMLVPNEFNRGGLKVMIDHGHGIVTSSNHLGEALVDVGQEVHRGDPIAYSGYSGIDGFLFFPWSAPHVHFNVFLDGVHVDPFAAAGETSLWLGEGDPKPAVEDDDIAYLPTEWNLDSVQETIAHCRNQSMRLRLEAIEDTEHQVADVFYQAATYPTLFDTRPILVRSRHSRRPLLSLPFSGEDFIGVHY